MAGLLRRIRGASSIEDERERLRYAQESAARQLEAMKQELAERVRAIRDREHALDQALTGATGSSVVALPRVDDDPEITARERALAAREEMLARREQELAQPLSADERARIERRLTELREAEKLFLLTQAELASRSEAVASRERILASRERALGDGDRSDRSEITELEERLRRLERAGAAAAATDDAASFAGGLESLRRRGTRRST